MDRITQKLLENARGKWIKSVLSDLEKIGSGDRYIRKIILDNFNEYAREVVTIVAAEHQQTVTFRYLKDNENG